MRVLLLIAVVLLGIDALYYDGAHTQAGQRELSAAVTSLMANVGDELDRAAVDDAAPTSREAGPSTGG
jgi:hypothetical protein